MPTFRSKEIVDARQFDGSVEKAQELVAWFKASEKHYGSSTLQISKGVTALGSIDPIVEVAVPCLSIYYGPKRDDQWLLQLRETDWLILNPNGTFTTKLDAHFKKKYEQV